MKTDYSFRKRTSLEYMSAGEPVIAIDCKNFANKGVEYRRKFFLNSRGRFNERSMIYETSTGVVKLIATTFCNM